MKFTNGILKPYQVNIEWELKNIEQENQAKAEVNKNRVVKSWDSIKVNYIWTLTDGKEFDNSYTRGTPLEFTVWAGKMIPWFDKWVVGMKIWEKK